jgi:hypothetical protein
MRDAAGVAKPSFVIGYADPYAVAMQTISSRTSSVIRYYRAAIWCVAFAFALADCCDALAA